MTKKKTPTKKAAAKQAPAKKTSEKKARTAKKTPVAVEPKLPEVQLCDPSYQDKDIHLPNLVKSLALIFGVAALSFVAMLWMFKLYEKYMYNKMTSITPLEARRALPPSDGPILQVNERADLEIFRQREAKILNNYGLIDQTAGKFRLPIDRAMDLLLEKGLPHREVTGNEK